MPYLRLSTLALDDETKRRLIRDLTDTTRAIMPDEPPERTTIHFTPYAPEDVAVGGVLVAEGTAPTIELEISADEVDDKTWVKLSRRLTDVLVDALAGDPQRSYQVNVKLNSFDRATYSAIGETPEELSEPRGGTRWLAPAALVGFTAGAIVGYRWLTTRLRDKTTVDAAPPLSDAAGEAVEAGQPDPRKVISAAPESDEH